MVPSYIPEHYEELTRTIDPIDDKEGYSIKRGDAFTLGPLVGSKVRQCLHVVHTHLKHIQEHYNGGILTGAGLPSPQTAIVAGVAKYFGLKCAITVPRYDNSKRDFNRINVSLAQKFGATVYGVGNPNPAGYEKDAKELRKELGYFQVKFGMVGDVAMQPVVRQVQNVPDYIKRIVVISGSGLTALSIMHGLALYKKPTPQVYVVKLSSHFNENYAKWFDGLLPRWNGALFEATSPYPYRQEVKVDGHPEFDLTYESKAWLWMTKHFPPERDTLFWIVGRRCYDLNMIEPINWHMSGHETSLRITESLW